HSHFDEVFDLPPTFDVIASTDACTVQAFQVRDRPVWGMQFHPELSYDEGQRMAASNLESEPEARRLAVDDLRDPAQVEDQLRIFRNFFAADGTVNKPAPQEVAAYA
ncbi:MAG: hypothetical protein AAF657_24565, partial [Acidobacteriota bacterium]